MKTVTIPAELLEEIEGALEKIADPDSGWIPELVARDALAKLRAHREGEGAGACPNRCQDGALFGMGGLGRVVVMPDGWLKPCTCNGTGREGA